jgi:HEAT repeat protein
VQIFATPWILRKWGIVRAINLYFAGFLAMTFSCIFGGYLPINFVRGFEHSSHSLFMSGYHLAFYSVVEKSREFLRHIVEGMITPLGIIFAVLIVAGLKQFSALIFLPLVIATLAAMIFIVSTFLHKSRTKLAQRNFANAENISQKIRAIEVLGQSGHDKAHHLLASELKNQNHHQILREKIAETLAQGQNLETIHAYIQILEKEEEALEIKMRVLEAMLEIENLKEYSQNRHFMRFKIISVLQSLFNSAKSSYLKKLVVMNIFQHLPAEEIVPFFNKIMSSDDEKLQAVCLRSCAMFNDPDIVTFVEPYLSNSSPRVRSHAIISLWDFYDKEKLRGILDDFLSADHHEAKIAGIYAIGEIDDYQSLAKLHRFSREENLEVRLHSLVARAKMGDKKSVAGILELLFSANEKTAHKIFNMLKRGVPLKIREKIKEEVYREVASRVGDIVGPHLQTDKKDFSESTKKYLRRLYHFAGRYDDLMVLG